ncbi:MAG: excinuclease ABC subunit C [Verrucomicrobia bacterium RIFCSPHIGHO2_12_FULL_41_10]|nr:MAG: excinuclease ABC subunit C [Verrucomicrobia bacterium RIFCSPHIGHO2_12_FULL_41_10]
MRDRLQRIIYVGKARDLRRRLANYFTPSRLTRADLKTRALIDSIYDFEYHLVKSDAEAVLYEGKLIKEWRPKYNISFRDDKRFLLVRVHLGEPFPRFQLTRLRKEDGARYFGPFPNAGALRSTLRTMIKKFGIRSCRPTEPTEKDFKHCLDHIIQNCSAPCIFRVTREEYHQRVLSACEFLEGKSRVMIESIEADMKEAAERLDFEKAASLRNLLNNLEETTKPMRRFTRKSLPNSIDPEADLLELQQFLSLPQEPRVMECFDISNLSDTHCVASMVQFRNGLPDKQQYRRYRITSTQGQDDFASMAEVIRRRYRRILMEASQKIEGPNNSQESLSVSIARSYAALGKRSPLPDLIIVDGGKGQLSVACRELQILGLYDIPIIGLAKEFEEIYRPGETAPLRLHKNTGALRLLQRIRDEAHRIANGYHELLLRRRISESALDTIPGISESKKKALLLKFGSVRRLREVSSEEIATTKGIGKNLAQTISEHFKTTNVYKDVSSRRWQIEDRR